MASGKVIVIGNEKGGTGKSTVAMHLIVWYMQQGKMVASVDVDGKQGTLTHYIQNRANYATMNHINLTLPQHIAMDIHEYTSEQEKMDDELAFQYTIQKLKNENDVVIIDTPGADSFLFRTAHSFADILITPINDSLIDIDVLAKIEPETLTVKSPGQYAQIVWQARQKRASQHKSAIKWFVLRNRLPSSNTKNGRVIWKILEALGKRINFTPIPGLGERVIFRDLFLKGLTLLDFGTGKNHTQITAASIPARQELRNLLISIGEKVV
ncbi:MAG: division plane positioning ATPase MipZ [Alphaproteobacteria bacterium]|nr:division plane positioning ATPase MipZ [Alphaproteobacteria bacterium]